MTAMCTEVGNTSFDDCDALTWSFGCTVEPSFARRERREHLVHVHVRGGAASRSGRRRSGTGRRSSPAMTSSAARDDRVGDRRVEHAELLVGERGGLLDARERRRSARARGRSPEIGKFSTARWVCARVERDRRARAPHPSCRARCGTRCRSRRRSSVGACRCVSGVRRSASDAPDDDVGHGRALDQSVVRADDSQRTRCDGVADQLGELEQLGDGVAQVLAADELGIDRRRAATVDRRSRSRRAARPARSARSAARCAAAAAGASGASAVDRGAHRAALVVPEHDDERHVRAPRRRTRASRCTESEMTWPALRTTNRSPRPLSKMISAERRESLHPNRAARGAARAPARRGARRPGGDAAGSPATKRSLPRRISCHALRGRGSGHGLSPDASSRSRRIWSETEAAASSSVASSADP